MEEKTIALQYDIDYAQYDENYSKLKDITGTVISIVSREQYPNHYHLGNKSATITRKSNSLSITLKSNSPKHYIKEQFIKHCTKRAILYELYLSSLPQEQSLKRYFKGTVPYSTPKNNSLSIT